MTWDVVPFASTFDNQIRQRAADWDRLVQTLTTFKVHQGDKKSLQAWSPTKYKPDTTRGGAGVETLSCLVLDYDSGTTIEAALQAWRWRPGMLHTSWSHTEDHHKFRVIMPLHEPVSPKDWPAVFAWADRWTRGCTNELDADTPESYHLAQWQSTIDPACKDPGRLYYVPSIRADDWPRYATSWHPPGGYLGIHTPWCRQLDRLSEAQEAKKKRQTFPKNERVHGRKVRKRRAKQRLKHDPAAREEMGCRLGGTIAGNRVTGVTCPSCARRDVWWFIDADRKSRAECNHRNSCGWSGSLWELAA